jgi:tetratricopeptide (TPR) repeat protein
LGEALGEILAIALADQKGMVVVERQKLRAVLDEQRLTLAGLADPATAARVGKLLHADVVVVGSLLDAGKKRHWVVRLVAVDGGRVLGSEEADAAPLDFTRAALDLSARVAAAAGVRLPAVRPEDVDDSPVGRLQLMRGVSFYYADNPDQAIVYCLRAVRLDPRLVEARLWIARAYLRLGEADHARAELKRLADDPAAAQYAGQVKELLAEGEKSPWPRNSAIPP